MSSSLPFSDSFVSRHIGPREHEIQAMLAALGVSSLDELIEKTVPGQIRLPEIKSSIPEAISEHGFLQEFSKMAKKNKIRPTYIGMGYYDTLLPPVIQRNILENPAWYTAYTPYQAEIAQGRLEMLLNFQTVVMDLTGMEIANASLLDEATAAAEAMTMLHAVRKGAKKSANVFFVSDKCHPQTIALLQTRAVPIGIELKIASLEEIDVKDPSIYGLLAQYPTSDGAIFDYEPIFQAAKENQIFVSVATDLLALTLLKSPGSMGADVVVGSSQRFGVPLGFGGPHAAFFATRDDFKRNIPGRIIGVSIDRDGKPALRMALQTREQHIRRDKATSNICTAQVLLAVISAAYAVYHGPEGLRRIAERVNTMTRLVAKEISNLGFVTVYADYFDTIRITSSDKNALAAVVNNAESSEINFRVFENGDIGLSLDQAKTESDLRELLNLFHSDSVTHLSFDLHADEKNLLSSISPKLLRTDSYMDEPVFHMYRSEHDMLRYLKRLENKDLSLVHSMISLGSCTMKLNATAEMMPVTWPEFSNIHPFVPKNQAEGYYEMFHQLETWLEEVTGFDAVSLQPNSGAQGEYAGLMTIRAYHEARDESHRTIALIPSSAHGTNPASAVMAGMKVVVVACDEKGNIDINDLKSKAEQHTENLSCMMVTYPSTHGVFEGHIKEMCKLIHENGGLVYMDGANMNAQVGLTSPAAIGADVCHLNLHKTFCIPHGGGGPGMGPIGVNKKLAPFLPKHPVVEVGGELGISPISAAPYGSASILPISYAYIRMMGKDGIRRSTEIAILNANYLKKKLESEFPVLYTGENGFAAHEFIMDLRPFKQSAGIEVEDIAKRLMDYGFHSPTVSFPVAGTMMVEPTESEPKAELDRFVEAMLQIREEIREIEMGVADKNENVLKMAPHTAETVISDEWNRPYSREKAAFPLSWVRGNKFWPSVSRIDSAYGDRNLVCSCTPIHEYVQE